MSNLPNSQVTFRIPIKRGSGRWYSLATNCFDPNERKHKIKREIVNIAKRKRKEIWSIIDRERAKARRSGKFWFVYRNQPKEFIKLVGMGRRGERKRFRKILEVFVNPDSMDPLPKEKVRELKKIKRAKTD